MLPLWGCQAEVIHLCQAAPSIQTCQFSRSAHRDHAVWELNYHQREFICLWPGGFEHQSTQNTELGTYPMIQPRQTKLRCQVAGDTLMRSPGPVVSLSSSAISCMNHHISYVPFERGIKVPRGCRISCAWHVFIWASMHARTELVSLGERLPRARSTLSTCC